MFEKEAEEYIDKLTKDWSDGEYSFSVEELRQAILHFAEFGYNKGKEELKICEQNADAYYDKLQKAKQIIQEFLELNYSEFTKTNAVFLHADKFLKESK